MRYTAFILCLLLLTLRLWGQQKELKSSQTYVLSRAYIERRIAELEADGELSEELAETWLLRYEDLLDKPLEINTLSYEDLLDVPLVDEYQAYQFIQYRLSRYGAITTPEELRFIAGWDADFFDYIYPLLYVSEKPEPLSWDKLLRQGRSRLSLFSSYPLVDRAKQRYIGSPEALSLRYNWQSTQKLSVSFAADKDSYEPWQYKEHRGFDSYHGHLALRDMARVRQLILGQYRASWAEGLLLGQGFRLGNTQRWVSRLNHYTPSRSSAEVGISQGIMIDVALNDHLSLSALSSWRKVDGRVDALNQLRALSDLGLHRSEQEWSKRRAIAQRYIGLAFLADWGRWAISLQALAYDWSGYRLKQAPRASYNNRLHGLKSFSNMSIGYRHSSPRGYTKLAGELAWTQNLAIATSHRLGLWHSHKGALQLNFRYISPDYWAYYASARTHYALPNNEFGLGLSYETERAEGKPLWLIEADYYKSIKSRSKGVERGGYFRINLEQPLSRYWTSHLRLGYSKGSQTAFITSRMGLRYHRGVWAMALRYEGKHPQHQGSKRVSWSYMFSYRVDYQPSERLRCAVSLATHDVPIWAMRIYHPEVRLSEQYSRTMLYGKGLRAKALFSAQLNKELSIAISIIHHSLHKPRVGQREIALQLIYKPYVH